MIRNVSDRLEKDLSAQNLEGEAIDIRQFDSIADEHEFLLQEVITLTQSGVPGKEIAILCPN